MEVTEVRISLREGEGKKLKAYATVTFDNAFVVRNIKVIEGNNGLFVAMPARKARQFCPRCGKKVDVGSKYCPHCGAQLPFVQKDTAGKQAMHQDIAHPINQEFRAYLQKKILDAYYAEKEKAPAPSSLEEKPESEPAANPDTEESGPAL